MKLTKQERQTVAFQLAKEVAEGLPRKLGQWILTNQEKEQLTSTLLQGIVGSGRFREQVFILMGASSTCWENVDKAGVFQSERAEELGTEFFDLLLEASECEGVIENRDSGINKRVPRDVGKI